MLEILIALGVDADGARRMRLQVPSGFRPLEAGPGVARQIVALHLAGRRIIEIGETSYLFELGTEGPDWIARLTQGAGLAA